MLRHSAALCKSFSARSLPPPVSTAKRKAAAANFY
jgi:hypothetical protein